MDKQGLVIGLLSKRLEDSKVGIIVKGISGIKPENIAADLATYRKTHIYVAVVGYDFSADVMNEKYTVN